MSENPGLESIEMLLNKVHEGDYVIPYFQRGFEWQPSMVCDLFESILQSYYTGLILFWELDKEAVREEKWEPIWGAKLKVKYPEKAVLDGQQRLASLYYAIYNPKKKFPQRYSYYRYYVNLNKVLNSVYEDSISYKYSLQHHSFSSLKISELNIWSETGIVPLSILSEKDPTNPGQKFIDSKEFDDWLNNYIEKNRGELPVNITTHKVFKVFNQILNYSFVYFPLDSERNLPDICNIFARVNAKGMRLSTFDLMNAFLYPKGVKLRKELWENYNNVKLKNIDNNMNEYLLKLISLTKQNYCSSKFIYNLIPGEKTLKKDKSGKIYTEVLVKTGEEFNNLWKKSCYYAEKARKVIMNTGFSDFGAIKSGFIPNTTIIPVLGAVFMYCDDKFESPDFKRNLKKWYWSAVLSEDYSGSSDSVMAKDYRSWKEWRDSEIQIDRIRKLNSQFIEDLDFKNTRKGSALYNAVICILALNNSRDFFKGQIVGVGDYSNEKINDHHIFPKGVEGLNPSISKEFKGFKDCLLNRTLLLDETNISILNSKPSKYIHNIKEKVDSEKKVREIFRTHLINEVAFECLEADDFDNFIIEREKDIKKHLISMLELD